MKRSTYMILLLLMATAAFADPRQWDPNGVAIRTPFDLDWENKSARRDDGRVLAVWSEVRNEKHEVFGQLFAPDGAMMWEEGGKLLARSVNHGALYPRAISTSDGWIIGFVDAVRAYWGDAESGKSLSAATPRTIKIDDSGTPLWGAEDRTGILLSPSEVEFTPDIFWYSVSDQQGGAYFIWMEIQNNSGYDPRVQYVHADGTTTWNEPLDLFSMTQFAYNIYACSDGIGNLILCWSRQNAGTDMDIYAEKISPSGEFQWGDSTGIIVCDAGGTQRYPQIIGDNGNAYVVWSDYGDTDDGIYAQRIDSDGNALWTPNGVPVVNVNGGQSSFSMTSSFMNGMFDGFLCAWPDERGGTTSPIYAQKISPDGNPVWTSNGISLCDAPNVFDYYPNIISDLAGGAVVNWQSYVNGSSPIQKVARIGSIGTIVWGQDCGIQISSLARPRTGLQLGGYKRVHLFWSEWIGDKLKAISQVLNKSSGAEVLPDDRIVTEGNDGYASYPQTVSLGNGRVAMVWTDGRDRWERLYFQIVDTSGAFLFEEDGVPLTAQPDTAQISQRSVSLTPDGAGGFFAAYTQSDVADVIRIVHLDHNGVHVANPLGTVLETTSDFQTNSFCVGDGQGNCYVAFGVYDESFLLDTYVFKVNSQCEPVWTAPIILNGADIYDVTPLEMTLSSDGCILSHQSGIFGAYALNLAKISSDGELQWDQEVAGSFVNYPRSVLVNDEENGAYLVWEKFSPQFLTDIYGQHVTADGEMLWPNEGLPIVATEDSQIKPAAVVDNLGNLIVVWQNFVQATGDVTLRGQRILPSGQRTWPADGVLVAESVSGYYSQNQQILALDSENIFVTWTQDRPVFSFVDAQDIFATHLNSTGDVTGDNYWQPHAGGLICNYASSQNSPIICADGVGGIICTWEDTRVSYSARSVFAQRIYDPVITSVDKNPSLATEFSLSQNYPNPFNPSTEIVYSLSTNAQTTLKVFDVTGREVKTLVNQVMTAGEHKTVFDAAGVPSGVYFYQLKAGEFSTARKMVLIR